MFATGDAKVAYVNNTEVCVWGSLGERTFLKRKGSKQFIRCIDAVNISFFVFLFNLDNDDCYISPSTFLYCKSEHQLFAFSEYIPELFHYQSQNWCGSKNTVSISFGSQALLGFPLALVVPLPPWVQVHHPVPAVHPVLVLHLVPVIHLDLLGLLLLDSLFPLSPAIVKHLIATLHATLWRNPRDTPWMTCDRRSLLQETNNFVTL